MGFWPYIGPPDLQMGSLTYDRLDRFRIDGLRPVRSGRFLLDRPSVQKKEIGI